MLKEPYNYVYSVGYNKYYYLKLTDMPYTFLAAVSEDTVVNQVKRLFRKPKEKEVNIPVAHKMLPLNALVLFILYNANMITPITYELDVEGNKIDIYGTWDEFDIDTLQKTFKKAVLDVAGISNYDLPYTVHNLVARGFDKDGYHFLGVEHSGQLSRTYWLVRTNQYGAISFVAVNESGTLAKSLTTAVNIFLLDKNLITKINEDFMDKKLTQPLTKEEILDIDDIKNEKEKEQYGN